MMAVVLVCVVETGMPVKVARPMQKHAERHAAKPCACSMRTMFMPTDLMILRPPMAVPKAMDRETSNTNHRGNDPSSSDEPVMAIITPSMASDRNFWPSCAPWRMATPAPEMICAHLKPLLALRRLQPAKMMLIRRMNSQPLPKPKTVEMTRP